MVVVMNENQVSNLMEQYYTRSLANSLTYTKGDFALRIWIVDNSGSMHNSDGRRLLTMTRTLDDDDNDDDDNNMSWSQKKN